MLLGMALSLLAVTSVSALEQRVITSRYRLAPGGALSVENVQGGIEVEGWDRAEVEVTITKTASSALDLLDDVRIVVESSDRALAFHTLCPQDSDEPVKVDYRLRVPRQLRLERLRTVYGNIKVRDIEGAADLRSLNGSIEAEEFTGRLAARAVNGNVVASLRALPDSATPLDLDTLSGNLYLLLPARANADLEVSTVAGKIESDYVFQTSAAPGDNTRRARLGRGGPRLRLRTVRGNVRVGEREDVL
jgi:hypothetical protein